MKRQDDLRPRERGADKTKEQETAREISADMEVNHLVPETQQQSQHCDGVTREVDVVAIASLVSGEVDDRARDATAPEEIPQCDEIGLHSAPRRGIGAEKQNAQRTLRFSRPCARRTSGRPNGRLGKENGQTQYYRGLASRLTYAGAKADGQ